GQERADEVDVVVRRKAANAGSIGEDRDLVVIEQVEQAFRDDAQALGELELRAGADHEADLAVIAALGERGAPALAAGAARATRAWRIDKSIAAILAISAGASRGQCDLAVEAVALGKGNAGRRIEERAIRRQTETAADACQIVKVVLDGVDVALDAVYPL